MIEVWKSIPGYEYLYEASNLGRIRTAFGKTTRSARFASRVWKQRVLKLKWQARKGGAKKDARVTLWKDGEERTHLVARLVAKTWCDGYAPEMTVNHIDGDSSNNRASNLEWVTHAENIRKGYRDGLYPGIGIVLIDNENNAYEFRTLEAATRFLGRCHGYVHGRVSRNRDIPGYKYRLLAKTS